MYQYWQRLLFCNAAVLGLWCAGSGIAIAQVESEGGAIAPSEEQVSLETKPNLDPALLDQSPNAEVSEISEAVPSSFVTPNSSTLDAVDMDLEARDLGERDLEATDLEATDLEATDLEVVLTPNLDAVSDTDISDTTANTISDIAIELSPSSLWEAMSQVTSVSQLSDVQPTDWAFPALQSLVERYGCIAGYPDSTFRGNRALTRYEFAAGLNACLDRINELILIASEDLLTQEDLIVLQRLQEEFSAELATLRGRVDALDARTSELEANQFSTTTRLTGLAFFHLTGAFANGPVQVETTNLATPLNLRPAGRNPITGLPVVQTVDDDPEITFSHLVWLNFNTSFTGRDSLVTQFAVGNGNSPANTFASAGLYNTFGVPFVEQSPAGNSSIILRELSYSFPVGDTLRFVVGPRINWYRYFDGNSFTFFLTGAGSFNSSGSTLLNTLDRGSGAVALWQPTNQLRLAVAYLGENTEFLPASIFNSASDPNKGLFGGTNTLTTEITYSPFNTFNLRLLYNRSNLDNVFGTVGGALSEPLIGIADDGAGGPLDGATADTFNINFDWLVTPGLGVFGRYTYGSTNISPGSINTQAFQAGVAFPDLGREGALATISYLIPFSILDGREFLISGGGDGGVQFEFEASYYYPLNDNIALVPSFYVIANANNFSDNPTIYVGNLRAQFGF